MFGNIIGSGWDDPKTAATLALAQQLLGGRGGGMQRLAAGLGGYQQAMGAAKREEDDRKRRALQDAMLTMQMQQALAQQAAAKKAQEQQAAIESAYRGAFVSPEQQALAGGGGPTVANAKALGGLAPKFDQQRLIQELMQVDPIRAAELSQPKPADMVALNPGQVLFDKTQGKSVFEAPKAPDMNQLLIPDGKGGFTVNSLLMDARKAIAQAGATRVNTPVQFMQEREESKAAGKFFGEAYGKILDSGLSAQRRIDRASRMEDLMSRINTGRLEGIKKEVSAIAESFGLKIDPTLGDKEAFAALSNQLALEARDPSSGAGMPGAMSDKDREFLVKITPNLTNTPAGNKIIIETQKRLAKRDKEVAALAREYRKRTGSLDEGFFDELAEFSANNPLFGDIPAAGPGWGIRPLPGN